MIKKDVQEAVLRLMAWTARVNLDDHGYNVSDDIRLVLDQFEVVVKGPIDDRVWYSEANVSPTSSDHSMDSTEAGNQ